MLFMHPRKSKRRDELLAVRELLQEADANYQAKLQEIRAQQIELGLWPPPPEPMASPRADRAPSPAADGASGAVLFATPAYPGRHASRTATAAAASGADDTISTLDASAQAMDVSAFSVGSGAGMGGGASRTPAGTASPALGAATPHVSASGSASAAGKRDRAAPGSLAPSSEAPLTKKRKTAAPTAAATAAGGLLDAGALSLLSPIPGPVARSMSAGMSAGCAAAAVVATPSAAAPSPSPAAGALDPAKEEELAKDRALSAAAAAAAPGVCVVYEPSDSLSAASVPAAATAGTSSNGQSLMPLELVRRIAAALKTEVAAAVMETTRPSGAAALAPAAAAAAAKNAVLAAIGAPEGLDLPTTVTVQARPAAPCAAPTPPPQAVSVALQAFRSLHELQLVADKAAEMGCLRTALVSLKTSMATLPQHAAQAQMADTEAESLAKAAVASMAGISQGAFSAPAFNSASFSSASFSSALSAPVAAPGWLQVLLREQQRSPVGSVSSAALTPPCASVGSVVGDASPPSPAAANDKASHRLATVYADAGAGEMGISAHLDYDAATSTASGSSDAAESGFAAPSAARSAFSNVRPRSSPVPLSAAAPTGEASVATRPIPIMRMPTDGSLPVMPLPMPAQGVALNRLVPVAAMPFPAGPVPLLLSASVTSSASLSYESHGIPRAQLLSLMMPSSSAHRIQSPLIPAPGEAPRPVQAALFFVPTTTAVPSIDLFLSPAAKLLVEAVTMLERATTPMGPLSGRALVDFLRTLLPRLIARDAVCKCAKQLFESLALDLKTTAGSLPLDRNASVTLVVPRPRPDPGALAVTLRMLPSLYHVLAIGTGSGQALAQGCSYRLGLTAGSAENISSLLLACAQEMWAQTLSECLSRSKIRSSVSAQSDPGYTVGRCVTSVVDGSKLTTVDAIAATELPEYVLVRSSLRMD
jgi:hypothetical protein